MGDYGLRISKDGYDVLSDADDRNMVFTSKGSVLKVFMEGSVDISIDNGVGGGGAIINHALGYVPMAFVVNITSGVIFPSSSGFPGALYWMDTDNLYISYENIGEPTHTDTFKYQILVDKIE